MLPAEMRLVELMNMRAPTAEGILRRVGSARPGPAHVVAHVVDSNKDLKYANTRRESSSEKVVHALPLPPEFAYLEGEMLVCRAFLAKKLPILTSGPGDSLHLGPPPDGKSYTLVLDLDNTMLTSIISEHGAPVHGAQPRPAWEPSASVEVKSPKKGRTHKVEVWFRPGLLKFLASVSQRYEIVIFSAGNKRYVKAVIQMVDPDKKYISCIMASDKVSFYNIRRKRSRGLSEKAGVAAVKNISGFFEGDHPRHQERVVCVDDRASSFVKHLRNVVSVHPFFGDVNDKEIEELSKFLMHLTNVADVREEIKKRCNLPAHVGSKSRYRTSSAAKASSAER